MFASKESRADGKEKRTRRADFERSGEESGRSLADEQTLALYFGNLDRGD